MLDCNRYSVEGLEVRIFPDRELMGRDAAAEAASRIKSAIEGKGSANVVFAAAPSQLDMLKKLSDEPGLDWSRVNAFHLDDYHLLPKGAPQRFDSFLHRNLWDKVRPGRIFEIAPKDGMTMEDIKTRYERLLKEYGPDLSLVGIGENGHLAFMDPPVADFDTEDMLVEVELDPVCRMQQVHDGAFASLDDVPLTAATMTIPAIMSAKSVICVVPTVRKAEAVRRMLNGPVETDLPASVLRRHPDAILFLDKEAASLL